VLIPGVNDEHLVEVSRTVRELGAFLHNVMPLVSAPEHGTHFGLTGQRGPTPEEVRAVQDACEHLGAEGDDADGTGMTMGMMRHCRQCRADAVGMLDEDRSQEFTGTEFDGSDVTEAAPAGPARLEPLTGPRPAVTVRVAVATTSGALVDQHFGHAEEFRIYETGVGYARFVETRSVARYCHGPAECPPDEAVTDEAVTDEAVTDDAVAMDGLLGVPVLPGAGTGAGHNLPAATELLSDCAAVLCNRIGAGPRRQLEAHGIEAVEVYDVIEHAVTKVGARLAEAATTGRSEATAS
jgi:nitrogen fixation protein NifB